MLRRFRYCKSILLCRRHMMWWICKSPENHLFPFFYISYHRHIHYSKLSVRANDPARDLLLEKHGLPHWICSGESRPKTGFFEKMFIFLTFYKTPTTPLGQNWQNKSVQSIVQMVYNPKNTGSTTSDGSVGSKWQKTIKKRKKSIFSDFLTSLTTPLGQNWQMRTIDSTDGVQPEKHGFSNFWRLNREEMSKNHKNEKILDFSDFFKSPTTPLWKKLKK